MSLYYVATHHIFMWVAVTLAVIGNVLVWGALEKVFVTNRPSWLVTAGDFRTYRSVQRAAHLGIFGIELKLIALVMAGVYVACYPATIHTVFLAVYFVWYLIMAVFVMVGTSRVKRWWVR